MKKIYLLLLVAVASCNNPDTPTNPTTNSTETITDSAIIRQSPAVAVDSLQSTTDSMSPQLYANDRFKEVKVLQQGPESFLVTGKARVFEAAFSWVVEDGHQEITSGHEMTNAGAPAWGDFSFTVAAKKAQPNSTLTLILFEASAKDGSRQSELAIPLY